MAEDRGSAAEQAILQGGVTLAFDTCCIIGRSADGTLTVPFNQLATTIDRLREEATPPHALEVVVPSPVHFEVLHDLRLHCRATGLVWDPEIVVQSLRSKGVRVAAFDEAAALSASGRLFEWYPSEAEWQTAKGHSPATIDWLIAAQADAAGWVLVTDDRGRELDKVRLVISRQRIRRVLRDLCQDRGISSGF